MSVISVRDNENNRWKRKAKKANKQTNKDRQEQGETEAILKGWELNDFAVYLSRFFRISFISYFKTKRIIWVKAYLGGV